MLAESHSEKRAWMTSWLYVISDDPGEAKIDHSELIKTYVIAHTSVWKCFNQPSMITFAALIFQSL